MSDPEKVIDREGDEWVREPDGRYSFGFCREASLDALRENYGPLTVSEPEPFITVGGDSEFETRREALRVARDWAREDAGEGRGFDGPGTLALTYARFLMGESAHA